MTLFFLVLAAISFGTVVMTFTKRGREWFNDQLTEGPRIHLLRFFFALDGAVLVYLALR